MKPNIHFKVEFNTAWQLYVYGPFYALLSPFLIWLGIAKVAIISLKLKLNLTKQVSSDIIDLESER